MAVTGVHKLRGSRSHEPTGLVRSCAVRGGVHGVHQSSTRGRRCELAGKTEVLPHMAHALLMITRAHSHTPPPGVRDVGLHGRRSGVAFSPLCGRLDLLGARAIAWGLTRVRFGVQGVCGNQVKAWQLRRGATPQRRPLGQRPSHALPGRVTAAMAGH